MISYASKTLSSVKRRYSRIEREALVIAWGFYHSRMYFLESLFKVMTDNKPLLAILPSPLSQASAGIENWHLKIKSLNFKVLYPKGDLNSVDYIVRHFQGDRE